MEYETSWALSKSKVSAWSESEVPSPSEISTGVNSVWNLCKIETSLAVASNLSSFLDEERFQKSSRVVDIISAPQDGGRDFFDGRQVSIAWITKISHACYTSRYETT